MLSYCLIVSVYMKKRILWTIMLPEAIGYWFQNCNLCFFESAQRLVNKKKGKSSDDPRLELANRLVLAIIYHIKFIVKLMCT